MVQQLIIARRVALDAPARRQTEQYRREFLADGRGGRVTELTRRDLPGIELVQSRLVGRGYFLDPIDSNVVPGMEPMVADRSIERRLE